MPSLFALHKIPEGESQCCKTNIPWPTGMCSPGVCTQAPHGAHGEQWCHALARQLTGKTPKPTRFIAGLGSWPSVPQSNIPAICWSILQDASCLVSPGWNSSLNRCNMILLPSPSVPCHLGRRLKPCFTLFCSFLQNDIEIQSPSPFCPGVWVTTPRAVLSLGFCGTCFKSSL